MKLSNLNTIEEAFLLLEEFSKFTAYKLWNKLSNYVEERSFEYVNKYLNTDMQIAAVVFDRQRKVRWSGSNGKDYIASFVCD